MNKGLINLATYSRPELLERCLKSIAEAKGSPQFPKLIILQKGNSDVASLVYSFADCRTQIVEVSGETRSPLQNINRNRWLSWKIGFDKLDYDWVLSVEEDVVLHPQSILFVEEIYERYKKSRRFRGINLGSRLCDSDYQGTFSELRFGLHGCGAVITKKTWNLISNFNLDKKLERYPLDALIEPILKSGFMVTPNLSLINDFGWDRGTHTSPDFNDPHYVEIRRSYNTNMVSDSRGFTLNPIEPNWRHDCILYNPRDNFSFDINLLLTPILQSRTYRALYKLLRRYSQRIKRLIKNYRT